MHRARHQADEGFWGCSGVSHLEDRDQRDDPFGANRHGQPGGRASTGVQVGARRLALSVVKSRPTRACKLVATI